MKNEKKTEETTTGEESAQFFGEDPPLIEGAGDIELPPVVSNPVPLEDAPDTTPISSSPVKIVEATPEDLLETPEVVEEAPVEAEPQAQRIARAVLVLGDVVDNVLLVAVDDDDRVAGFPVPYGYECIVVDDESPIAVGWVRIDGEFVEPTPLPEAE